MNFTPSRRNRSVATLEVTPLVDVVFLLLIFFLLTATYVRNPNIDINLPKASSQELFPKDQDITVAVKKDGTVSVDNKSISMKQLETYLKNHISKSGKDAKSGKDTVIIVKADKGAKHGKVVSIMDLAKQVGFSKLAIAVDSGGNAAEN